VPRKTFVAGEILTAADVNEYLGDQAVMTFTDDAARTSALPTPSEGMVTFLSSTKSIDKRVGSAWIPASNGFTASSVITASNASWPVPTLASPIVKVTVIGGGGGGGGAGTGTGANGGNGGSTTFNAGGAGSVTAAGGAFGRGGTQDGAGNNGTTGFAAGNGGGGATVLLVGSGGYNGDKGNGGEIKVSYLNLSGISTVNVTIGAGGAAGAGTGGTAYNGGTGGDGVVIVEYVAG
jgi:hypothetical protein